MSGVLLNTTSTVMYVHTGQAKPTVPIPRAQIICVLSGTLFVVLTQFRVQGM